MIGFPRFMPLLAAGFFFFAGSTFAQSQADRTFVEEFDNLQGQVEILLGEHRALLKPFLEYVEAIQAKNSFRGAQRFSGPLTESGWIYMELADRAVLIEATDPRNVQIVETLGAAFLHMHELMMDLASCADSGDVAFCNDAFGSADKGVLVSEAEDMIAGYLQEADRLRSALAASPEPPRNELQIGVEGPVVLDVQTLLARLGYDPGPLSGSYSEQTDSALREVFADLDEPKPDAAAEVYDRLEAFAKQREDTLQREDPATMAARLADATGYLGDLSGGGLNVWLQRSVGSDEALNLAKQAVELERASAERNSFSAKLTAENLAQTLLSSSTGANACDVLAGDPDDGDASMGVALWDIQTDEAIRQCENAIRRHPEEARFSLQYARALVAAYRANEAVPVLKGLAALGSSSALAHLGIVNLMALDGPADMQEAHKYLSAAAPQHGLARSLLIDLLTHGPDEFLNADEARRWMAVDAETGGQPRHLDRLAEDFATGDGVAVDQNAALALMIAALDVEGGDQDILALLKDERKNEYIVESAEYARPTILLVQDRIAPGSSAEIEWISLPEEGQHWIAVSEPGRNGDEYYLNHMIPAEETSGQFSTPALPEGVYEIRLFLNWPDNGYDIADHVVVSVSEDAEDVQSRLLLLDELRLALGSGLDDDLDTLLSSAERNESGAVYTLTAALLERSHIAVEQTLEFAEPEAAYAAISFAAYAAELMPEDADVLQNAAWVYLAQPEELDLAYDAERLLKRAASLAPERRDIAMMYADALLANEFFGAAGDIVQGLWPPLPDEDRLIGLCSDVSLASDDPTFCLDLLVDGVPEALSDERLVAEVALLNRLGNSEAAQERADQLTRSERADMVALGRWLIGENNDQP